MVFLSCFVNPGVMKIRLVAAIIGLASLTVANATWAADMAGRIVKPAPAATPLWDWTGGYIGIQGGGGWGSALQTDATPFSSGDFGLSGGLVGATWGYNWQVRDIVGGFESDAAGDRKSTRLDSRHHLI